MSGRKHGAYSDNLRTPSSAYFGMTARCRDGFLIAATVGRVASDSSHSPGTIKYFQSRAPIVLVPEHRGMLLCTVAPYRLFYANLNTGVLPH